MKIKIISLLIVATAIVIGCKKDLGEPIINLKSNSLTVGEAKEWYYGVFKKSAEWQLSPEKGKKLPDWEHGIYKKVGNLEIVEFPLVKQKIVLRLYDKNLTLRQQQSIAENSLIRIAFIKNEAQDIVVRELDYVPSYEYLVEKNWDIGKVSINNTHTDFTGKLNVKKWNGENLAVFNLSKGGVIAKEKVLRTVLKPERQSNNTQNSQTCEWVPVESYEWSLECEFDAPNDNPVNLPPCEFIRTLVTNYEYQCTNDDPPPMDPDFPACTLGDENCICMIYQLNCEQGGGGDDPPPQPDPCTEAQEEANKANILSQNSVYSNAKSQIQTAAASSGVEHGISIGKDANGNIIPSNMTSGTGSNGTVGNVSNAFADIHNHQTLLPPSYGDIYGFIDRVKLNNNFETRYIVTSDGTVYALVVTNLQAAIAFDSAYPRVLNPPFEPEFPLLLDEEFRLIRDLYATNEMTLAFILEKYNSGIAILRQASNGDFKRLNTVKTTNSNNVPTFTANNCQ